MSKVMFYVVRGGKEHRRGKRKKNTRYKKICSAPMPSPHKKSGIKLAVPALKKRDCTIAVPLIEALVLPFVTNSNTVAHAVCINARNVRVHYLHTNEHLVSQCFGLFVNLPDSC